MVDAQPTVPIVPVVRIIARINVGGPALQVSALVDEIDPLRFEQLLLTRLVDRQEGDYLEPRSPNTPPVVVPGLGRSIRPLDDLRAFRTIVSHLRRVRPTIVPNGVAIGTGVGAIFDMLAYVAMSRRRPRLRPAVVAVVTGARRPLLAVIPIAVAAPIWLRYQQFDDWKRGAAVLPALALAFLWLSFGCLSQSDRAALLSTSRPRP